jgi:Domain of unknown function (DUF4838)/Carbohydrate family 9 binding domain-like
MKNLILATALSLLTMQLSVYAATESSINLVTNNKSDFSIVISKVAPVSTVLAARELQTYIKKTAGVKLPIINQASGKGKDIFLGNNAALPKESRFNSDSYKDEKYAIFNWQGNLVIIGGEPDVDPRRSDGANFGLLYGVYDFIEKYLGTRWYAPGELGECIDKKSNIVVNNLPVEYKPPYTFRSLWPRITEEATSQETLAWLRRLKVFGSKPNNVNHSLDAFSYEHRDTLEIFALDAHGKRIFGKCTIKTRNGQNVYKWTKYPQLCLSSPKLIEMFINAVNGWYANGAEKRRGTFYRTPHDKNYIYLSFADNFGGNPCHCPKCTKVRSKPNGFSNLVWSFVAKVATRLKTEQPGKKVSTLAYNKYATAPDKNIKIPDNVVVKICVRPSIIYFGGKAYKDKTAKIIDDWTKRVKDISFWQYHNNFGGSSIYPLDIPHIIHDFYQRYQKNASSTFFQPGGVNSKKKSTHVIKNMPREIINTSFTMRSLWNPSYDVNLELNKFYRLFFGPSSKEMKKYYDTILARWEHIDNSNLKSGNAVSGNVSATVIYKQIYPFSLVKKLDKYIRAARKKSTPGSIYRKRVDWFIKELHEPFYKLSQAYFKDNNNKELDIYESVTAPQIDGKLDDGVWKKTERYNFFNTSGPVAPSYPTSFQMVIKDNVLYIALKAVDPHSDNQKLDSVKRDSAPYLDDSVELFVVPDVKHPERYYQIVINLNNVIYDSRNDKAKKKNDVTWQSNIRIATKKMSGAWQMELAVPLKDFGIKEFKLGQQIGFNICRNKKSGIGEEHEASQWVPTSGSFHRTEAFGTMKKMGKPLFIETFGKTGMKLGSCKYQQRYKVKTKSGASVKKECFLQENISYTIKDGKLSINAICLPTPDITDRMSFAVKGIAGVEIGDKTRLQIKLKSSKPGVLLLAGYAYEDTEGEKCRDYVKIRTADGWLVKSFDLRDGGQYAPKRIKENKRFGVPKIFKGMTIYIDAGKFKKKTPFKLEVDYIKLK